MKEEEGEEGEPRLHHPPKWVLVTNVTPGSLAEAFTQSFRTRGFNVIATSPTLHKSFEHVIPTTIGGHEGFLIRVHLDPTHPGSLTSAVELVAELTNHHLSFLINTTSPSPSPLPSAAENENENGNEHKTESGRNGYNRKSITSPLLDLSIPHAKHFYDAHIWSPLAITQAFFPLLYSTGGVVVNFSSIAGLAGYSRPFQGVSSSSHAAMAKWNDIMRMEFEPLGVRVVGVVGRGGTRRKKREREKETEKEEGEGGELAEEPEEVMRELRNGIQNGLLHLPEKSLYLPLREHIERSLNNDEEEEDDDDDKNNNNNNNHKELAEQTIEALLQPGDKSPTILHMGYIVTFIWLIHWLFPMWLLDMIHRSGSGLEKLRTRTRKGLKNMDEDDHDDDHDDKKKEN